MWGPEYKLLDKEGHLQQQQIREMGHYIPH